MAAGPTLASEARELTLFGQRNEGGARYTLTAARPNMVFSPRSARVTGEGGWQLCARPFFGGACTVVAASTAELSLPRGFSGTVRSARPLPPPAGRPARMPEVRNPIAPWVPDEPKADPKPYD